MTKDSTLSGKCPRCGKMVELRWVYYVDKNDSRRNRNYRVIEKYRGNYPRKMTCPGSNMEYMK